mmetsp:Transcript_33545/g.72511  ORF Transcript_33545/g.72511 Transcript_33545/m.72511 type:complete len:464 (+) Transcript_33545:188-1579(+)
MITNRTRRCNNSNNSINNINTMVWNKRNIENMVLSSNMPKYFDDGPIVKVKGGKKRKRALQQHQQQQHAGWHYGVDGNHDPSSVLPPPHGAVPHGVPFPGIGGFPHHHPSNTHAVVDAGGAGAAALKHLPPGIMNPPPPAAMMGGPTSTMMGAPPPPPRSIVVAGHDGGYPAPNFLQPLASRESHPVTSWEDAVPSMPSYVNGRTDDALFQTPSSSSSSSNDDKNNKMRFRHRPRLGRGGRIVIDRIPCPSHSCHSRSGPHQSNAILPPPPAVVTYGSGMERSGYDIATLGADGPGYFGVHSGPENKSGPLAPPPPPGTIDFGEGGTATSSSSRLGTDAASAPKAPPARCLADLLPKPPGGGDPTALSRRLQEICALGLLEDYQTAMAAAGATASSTLGTAATMASTSSSSKGGNSSSAAAAAAAALAAEEEMEEVLVPMEDWMEAPEGLRVYGAEKFVIGPI